MKYKQGDIINIYGFRAKVERADSIDGLYAITSGRGKFSYHNAQEFDASENIKLIKGAKCECGSEITNSLGHSDWCPKYEEK